MKAVQLALTYFLLVFVRAPSWSLRGLTLQEYFAARDPVSGTVYHAMLLVFAAMPLLVYRK
ncbi:MAG TPA: hypothetical protein VNT02_01840 [Burkholderiales bacterium]|nr:hypothetical protein [Burkholderiales bacterium]